MIKRIVCHPHSPISDFVARCLGIIIPILAISKDEQAGLSFTWSQIPKDRFSVTWLIFNIMKLGPYFEPSCKVLVRLLFHRLSIHYISALFLEPAFDLKTLFISL